MAQSSGRRAKRAFPRVVIITSNSEFIFVRNLHLIIHNVKKFGHYDLSIDDYANMAAILTENLLHLLAFSKGHWALNWHLNLHRLKHHPDQFFSKMVWFFIISCFLLRYTSCPYSIGQQGYESSFSPKNDTKCCSKYNVFRWEPCW